MSLFPALCSPSLRPHALNLLASHLVPKQNRTPEGLCSRAGVVPHPSLSEAHTGQVAGGSDSPVGSTTPSGLGGVSPQPPAPSHEWVVSLLNPLCVLQTHNTEIAPFVGKNREQTQVLILSLTFSEAHPCLTAGRDLSLG